MRASGFIGNFWVDLYSCRIIFWPTQERARWGQKLRLIAKIILVLGLLFLVMGAVVAFALPAGTTFQSKTATLLENQVITGEAPWLTDNGSVLSERVTTIGDLFDPVGPNSRTYDSELTFGAFIFGEIMDDRVTVSGTAEETLGNTFNFLVFNEVNFDLWKLGQTSSAFYSQSNVVDHTFSFKLNKDQATGLMYFVMEKTSEAQQLLSIRILANADWVEENRFPVRPYESVLTPLILAPAENFVLSGTASESSDINFNFYILDDDNSDSWRQGQPFTSIYESIGASSATFSIPLTLEQANFEFYYFVVENPGLVDQDVTVTVSADLEYDERAVLSAAIAGVILGGTIAGLGVLLLIVGGVLALVLKPKPAAPAEFEMPPENR